MTHSLPAEPLFILGILVLTLIPLPSIQHFVWPVDQCLLADICNHTWYPECGWENKTNDLRLFLDDCDMNEYNCDHNRAYEIVNMTICYQAHTGCPTVTCPSYPTCKDHNYHRMRARYTPTAPPRRAFSIPKHWLNGKRRYKKKRKKKKAPPTKTTKSKKTMRRKTTAVRSLHPPNIRLRKPVMFRQKVTLQPLTTSLQPSNVKTFILRKEKVWRNGKIAYKVFKKRIRKQSSGYLEK